MSTLIDSFPHRERILQEKLALKEKSNLRVKNWPNTLEAKRKKKDEARFERFRAEEEERRKVDKEEAILQAIKKKEILTRANNQIYEDKAKVRALKGQMLLSDALQERELQKEVNQRKAQMEKQGEEQYYEYMMEKIEEEEILEQFIKEDHQNKIKQYSEDQQKQHAEMKQKYIKRIQDDKIEGEIIKKEVNQKLQKEIQQKEEKKEKHLQALRDTQKANDILTQFKEIEKTREKQEDQKIEEFSKRKDEILQMRKVREDIKFKEKQAQIQRLIDTQVGRLKQLKDTEDERIKKQILEAEEKADEVERKKIAQIMQLRVIQNLLKLLLKADIDRHLAQSVQKRVESNQNEKIESQHFQEFWKTKNIDITKNEEELKQKIRNRNKDLQNFHFKQAEEKRQQLEKQFREEVEDAQKNKDFLDDEDHHFHSWAARAIDEWQNQGKDIKPLLLQMSKFQKITLG